EDARGDIMRARQSEPLRGYRLVYPHAGPNSGVLARMLEQALEEWQSLLGSEHVITESVALRDAGEATFRTHQRIPAILKPSTRAEVQECLRIATRLRVPVYPVSGGKN